ncbi:MAG TPA: tetratricopeptide repeat protein [Rhodanobacteraceae bacterium]
MPAAVDVGRDDVVMQRWDRIKDLFRQSMDLPESTRAAWLAEACADDPSLRTEVEALLRAQARPAPIFAADGGALLGSLLDDEEHPEDCAGIRIGVYRLLRLLGAGGMGQVFLAERVDADFSQRVALKRIRADFASSEARLRFLREREILARLVHPHIAQLHDGGLADDGTPYFTLEYVEGAPITRYCDEHKLEVRARLALLLQVCAAVAYAHRNLVVHRDLKPSNIPVTNDGAVKLLDFGIAKLLEPGPAAGLTGTQAVVMTREYAAPEQVLGEAITTATDVYALGVLTYELLTGHLPYPKAEAGETSFPKAIVDHAPEPLSLALRRNIGANDAIQAAEAVAAARASTPQALGKLLRGDLDRVVMRALEKSPDARYPSVGALADDLRAVLEGRSIAGGTRAHRARKFVRRHWLPLSAIAAALLAVIVGSAAIVFEARERARAAELALRETETTAAVKDFLLGLFAGADPRANAGKQVSVRDLLDKGADHIDNDLGSQPALQAELKATLGGIYSRLGLYPQAIKLQEQAIAGLDAAGGQEKLAAMTELDLAGAVRSSGDSSRAKTLLDDTITRLEALPAAPPLGIVRAYYLRVFVQINAHRYDAALADADHAEAIARLHPERPDLLGEALHAKASAHWGLHDYKNAEAELKEAIERHSAAGPTWAMSVGADRQTLALIESETGRYSEALALNEEVLANAHSVMGDRHPYVAQIRVAIANNLTPLGRYDDAERQLRQAFAIQSELLGPDSTYLAETQDALGAVLLAQRRYDEAEKAFAAARDIWTQRYGENHANVLGVRSELALIALARGQTDAGEKDLRAVLAQRQAAHESDLATDEARLGEAERRSGEIEAALANERSALAGADQIHGPDSWEHALAQRYLGLALADAGHLDEAEADLRSAIAYYDRLVGGRDHPLSASARLALGEVLARRPGGRADAIAIVERAAEQRERLFGAGDARTREAGALLADLRAGKPGTATPMIAMIDP